MIQVKVFLNTLNEQSQCLIFIEHESIAILLHDPLGSILSNA